VFIKIVLEHGKALETLCVTLFHHLTKKTAGTNLWEYCNASWKLQVSI